MHPIARSLSLPLALLALAGCGRGTDAGVEAAAPRPLFVDVTEAAGIRHVHEKPKLDPIVANIDTWLASVGAAAAARDYDKDGRTDLYVTTSHKGAPNRLYRNVGGGEFEDVAASAGLADVNDDGGTSMDCVWGDYDDDGWADLYLVRWGTDRLFRNLGDGRFEDVTERCFRRRDGRPGTDWANGNAAVWLDYDLDGRLDLYVGNYFRDVDLWNLETTRIMHDDFENSRNGGENFLFHQEADGTFTEVAKSLGVDDPGWTLAVGSADMNNDGRPDLYCANDFGPDQVFLNDPVLGFDDVSELAIGFDSKKGMNVDFGDFDNDGWLDIFVTNITTAEYLREGNMLWHNEGPGDFGVVRFADVALEAGTWDGGWAWGGKFLDADLDGDLDIVSVNGFITDGDGDYWYDLASWTVLGKDPADARNWPAIAGRSFSGSERKRFWRSRGDFGFEEVAAEVGLGTMHDGRGIVCFDWDDDGDLDLYFANQGQPPNLYRNDAHGAHWFAVALAGDPERGTRDAIGARVTIRTARGIQIRERDGGNGYAGQSDPRLYFGLGSATEIALCEVRWPDGGVQVVENPRVDAVLEISQDVSRYAAAPAIAIAPPVARGRKAAAEPPARLDEEQLDRKLAKMETAMRADLVRYGLASEYRASCATSGRHDRAIAFFEELVKARPADSRARIELALAYVDKIPTRGGLAAVVSKGTLARKSLNQLDRVLADDGRSWVALYCRGMNHLHWPRALRHSDDAVGDLTECLAMQASDPAGRDWYERVHVALGDAHAKAGRFDEARRAWRVGLELFPDSESLRERVQDRSDAETLALVESRRSLEQPIDTDLSFLDAEL
jgi:tetratricopeptide (TPR) repeat protein